MRNRRIGDYRIRSPSCAWDRSSSGARGRSYSRARGRSPSRARDPSPPPARGRSPPPARFRSPPSVRFRSPPPVRFRSPSPASFGSPPHARYRSPPPVRVPSPPLDRVRSPGLFDDERQRTKQSLGGDHCSEFDGKMGYDSHTRRNNEHRSWKSSSFDGDSTKFHWAPARTNYNTISTQTPIGDYGIGSSRKDYEGSGILDMDPHGMFVDKPISMDSDRARTFSTLYSNSRFSKGYIHLNDQNYTLPLKNNTRDFHNDEDLRFRDLYTRPERQSACELYKHEDKPFSFSRDTQHYNHLERPSTCELYNDEDQPLSYSSGISHRNFPTYDLRTSPVVTRDISKDSFYGSYKDDTTLPSDGFNRSSGVSSDFGRREGLAQASFYNSSANLDTQQKYSETYQQDEFNHSDGKSKDHIYPKLMRNERPDLHNWSDGYYENRHSIQEDFIDYHHSIKSDMVEPSSGINSAPNSNIREYPGDSKPWYEHHSFEENLISGHLDSRKNLYANKRDKEFLQPRRTYTENGPDLYQYSENLHRRDDYAIERDANHWTSEEKLWCSPRQFSEYEELYDYDNIFKPRIIRERGLHIHGDECHTKSFMDRKSTKCKIGTKITSSQKSNRVSHLLSDKKKISARRESDCSYLSNKSGFIHFQNNNGRKAPNAMASCRSSKPDSWLSSLNLSVSMQRRIGQPKKPSSKDILKRLKPAPLPVYIQGLTIKKPKPQKSVTRGMVPLSRKSHVDKGTSLEKRLLVKKTEPPEGSEEFRQLVYSAYLKFVKQLNGDSTQRRKYTEHISSLKCVICGSNSEEYVDTKSLAIHAFDSTTAGFRSQHLGLHKALCFLMGWNSLVVHNSWVCEALPDVEAMTLKEDLIIWPPVVIVHNSIKTSIPTQETIINSEVLKSYLISEGFEGANAKVCCRGEAKDESVIVVTFSGTLSGLQEAERLHKFYVENEHGRAEYDEHMHGDGTNETVVTGKVEEVLYGYLGLVGDFDKLDSETKKRCVVKSKKDIQAIADTPIKPSSVLLNLPNQDG